MNLIERVAKGMTTAEDAETTEKLFDAMMSAWDTMELAIKSGDWQVDGACDPSSVFEQMRIAHHKYFGGE